MKAEVNKEGSHEEWVCSESRSKFEKPERFGVPGIMWAQRDLKCHAGRFSQWLRMKLNNIDEGLIYLLREKPLELVQ